MKNEQIRKLAQNRGIKLWQIADKFGLSDGNFSRKLRHELTEEEKQKVITIIEELKGE